MTNDHKKKLIEAAMPLDAINEAAGRENNIHTGLPSNLHTWWSRKPLGIARAAIFGSLVDDPSEYCKSKDEEDKERERLFSIVRDLSDVHKGMKPEVLAAARKEIFKSNDGRMPTFWDPFCGGGSLPLEALRLGLDVIATDLNPVAVFLTRLMIDLAPRHAHRRSINPDSRVSRLAIGNTSFEGLKDDVLYYGGRVEQKLASSIGKLYPKARLPSSLGGGEASVVAWIWVRTVECPNPSCRVMAPLANKFWLSTHKGNAAYVDPKLDAATKRFRFEVLKNGTPRDGTVDRSGGICLACKNPISFEHVRAEGVAGRIDFQLMAMAVEGDRVRHYLPATDEHSAIAANCVPTSEPESELPSSALGFRVQKYGLVRHKDLFTKRQLTSIAALADAISSVRAEMIEHANGDIAYVDLVQAFLALSLSRVAQTNNTLVRWLVRASGTSKGTPAFDRQIVSMVWEFSEGNLFGTSVGSWTAALRNPLTSLNCIPTATTDARAEQADAAVDKLGKSSLVISTDPPYFDAIGYADLSDFFYIWLRRAMSNVHTDIFGTLLVPKAGDLTRNLGRRDVPRTVANSEFLERLYLAFGNIRSCASDDVPVTIYYAFKQNDSSTSSREDSDLETASNGWDILLDGLINSGFQITGTWPLRTEAASRLRAIGSNALASSILLVCRKKGLTEEIVSRAEFIRALKKELPAALDELKAANIAPPDMPQSAIGPGMAIFSRYKAVLEKDDSHMSIKSALQLINRELDEYLGGIQGEFDAETRFAITWFEQNGHVAGDYGSANSIAQARGISVESVKHAGIIQSAAGKVRILKREELEPDWDPATDTHLTIWEACQYLIHTLENEGELAAAMLLKKISSDKVEPAKDLAYCMYDICSNKRKDAKEATSYNALIAVWSDLTKLAASIHSTSGDGQYSMAV